MSKPFTVRGNRVLLAGMSEPEAASFTVRDGKIAEVNGPAQESVLDFGERTVMPGIVDTHAHINEPGRTDWEGFRTATRACAAGGITTVVDMPLNSIPATTTVAALETKARSASGACRIDYGLWGGVVPGNAGELSKMVRAGALGFKAFLIDSGVDEFPMSDEKTLREAMKILASEGVPLLAHAELDCGAPNLGLHETDYAGYLASRPPEWEVKAIRLLIGLARETGCRTHIVHLSAAQALPELKAARASGVPITAETCPHYLTFCSEDIPHGATVFKCAPPIRERANRELLWAGLAERTLDFVVSDHSPCAPGLKRTDTGSFEKAWGGISGLQFSLPATWSGLRERENGVAEVARLMCEGTAKFAGLSQKGSLAIGKDADFIVWDPAARFTPQTIHHRHPLTPYTGRNYYGVVHQTFVRGQKVYDGGEFPGPESGLWQKARV